MSVIFSHRKFFFAVFIISVALAVLLYRKVSLREDVTVMVPDSLGREVQLFQNSPLAKKIFVVVKSDQPADLQHAARSVKAKMLALEEEGISLPKADLNFLLDFYRYAPALWDEEMAAQTAPLLNPAQITAKMEQNVRHLSGPEGMYLQKLVVSDPVGLLPVFAERLKTLMVNSSLESSNGYLTSPDGTSILLVFDSTGNKFDHALSRKINQTLDAARAEFHPGTSAFLMGTARYTMENKDIVEHDLAKVLTLSAILMIGIFLLFFRERNALLLYLLPPVTVWIAAVVTGWVFGSLSGITLGFSAVLLGMASDYSTYVYFAMRDGRPEQRVSIMRSMGRTILLSAGVLILSFGVLALADIQLFKQLALFSVCGILVELFTSLCLAPNIFKCANRKERTLTVKPWLGRNTALASIVFILALGALCLPKVNFNFTLDALNTVTPQCERDRDEFETLTGNVRQKNSFLFVFGKDENDTILNSEKLSAQLSGGLPLTKLFVSRERAAKNLAAWHEFWNPQKISSLQGMLDREAVRLGLQRNAFAPFYNYLTQGGNMDAVDLRQLYNPFVHANGETAMVHILPENTAEPANSDVPTLLVSQPKFHRTLMTKVYHDIGLIMTVLFGLCLLLLTWILRNWRHALLCFVPCWCGIAMFFIVLAATGVECNLFGFFILPMLMGLGINYGIFMVRQQTCDSETHPTKAVLATALSTLAGFGALIIAQHKVLFIMGLGAFVGVLTAMTVSVLLLPPLLQKKNGRRGSFAAMTLLLASLILSACATQNIRYDVQAPSAAATAENAVEQTGVYRGELNFRSLMAKSANDCRVVVLSDFGVKLLDFKITATDAEVYTRASFLPGSVVEDFVAFYQALNFSSAANKDLTVSGGKTFYKRDGKEILWVKALQ